MTSSSPRLASVGCVVALDLLNERRLHNSCHARNLNFGSHGLVETLSVIALNLAHPAAGERERLRERTPDGAEFPSGTRILGENCRVKQFSIGRFANCQLSICTIHLRHLYLCTAGDVSHRLPIASRVIRECGGNSTRPEVRHGPCVRRLVHAFHEHHCEANRDPWNPLTNNKERRCQRAIRP
jgi:hypothetical protein